MDQKKEALAKITAEVNMAEDKLNKAKEELNSATMALQEELRKPVGTDEEMPGHTHIDIDEAFSTIGVAVGEEGNELVQDLRASWGQQRQHQRQQQQETQQET